MLASLHPAVATDFAAVFSKLKPILGTVARRLEVKVDKPGEYTLVTKAPSPFPQHKGQPLYFGSVTSGRLLRWYHWFHILAGWMLSTLAAAGFIGVMARNRQQEESGG